MGVDLQVTGFFPTGPHRTAPHRISSFRLAILYVAMSGLLGLVPWAIVTKSVPVSWPSRLTRLLGGSWRRFKPKPPRGHFRWGSTRWSYRQW
jgi:hypothetical protein